LGSRRDPAGRIDAVTRRGRAGVAAAAWLLAGSAARAADLPRLAGVVVSPHHRMALFEAGSGLVTQVAEGDRVDGYTVQAIGPGGVQLERDGSRVMLLPAPSGNAVVPKPIDTGGVTFGLVLHPHGPPDD
jgi:hypothetical protein